jgi:hypothetical protein
MLSMAPSQRLSRGVLPAHQRAGERDEHGIGRLADDGETDDRRQDLIGLAELLTVEE